jgi:hypothetical protein
VLIEVRMEIAMATTVMTQDSGHIDVMVVPAEYGMPHEYDRDQLVEDALHNAGLARQTRLKLYRAWENHPLGDEDAELVRKLELRAAGESEMERWYLTLLNDHLLATGSKPLDHVTIKGQFFRVTKPGRHAVHLGPACPTDDDAEEVESDRAALAERMAQYAEMTNPNGR